MGSDSDLPPTSPPLIDKKQIVLRVVLGLHVYCDATH